MTDKVVSKILKLLFIFNKDKAALTDAIAEQVRTRSRNQYYTIFKLFSHV